jgi:outer membrane autotransporter protein
MKDAASRLIRDNKISAGRSVRKWLCSTSLLVLAGAMPSMVHAQEWTGGVSTNWNTAANWQGGVIPGAGDVATIDNEGAGWPVINGGTHSIAQVQIGIASGGGSLTIMNGGKLNLSQSANIGLNFAGSATVTGGGSQMNVTDNLTVGYFSNGGLTVSSSGVVTSRDGYIGGYSGGTGIATVTSGGQLDMSNELFIGYGDMGQGQLDVTAGGSVTAAQKATLGFWAGSRGTLNVAGATSYFSSGDFIVGRQGTGDVIATGGSKIESSSSIIGEQAGSTGSVTIDSGATWEVGTALTVGALGTGTLNLTGGGKLESQTATIGRSAGGVGTATVSGTGTEWTNTGAFVIGRDGSGTMTLTNGAAVYSGAVTVGAENFSTGNLTVSNGGYWNSTGAMTVGLNGQGTMLVDNGVLLTNGGKIGIGFGGTGTVVLSNAGAWNAGSGTITVGGPGGSGSLTTNGGALLAQKLALAAVGPGSSANVAINAQSDVQIVDTVQIGSGTGSSGAMTVSGTGAFLTVGGQFGVGHAGDGTLLIENGGKTVVNNVVRIGFGSDATGAVTVTGAGSVLETNNSVRVGFEGNGSLTVENGGHILSNGAILAQGVGSTGTVLVTGSGSVWDARGANSFQVGGQGNSASLTVTDGALLQASTVYVGGESDASSNVMTVSGGARVESLNAFVGGTVDRSGTVLVTGAGSIWNVGDPNTYELRVGDAGVGLLRVENGGVVNGHVHLAQYGELSGNGTITGNTTLTSTSRLWGVQGETFTFGGDLRINSALSHINVALGTPGNTALFNVAGDLTLDGTLNVANAGGFGQGVYRIFDYGGTLTDNGLDVGSMPAGTSGTVQTAVANQVNLLVSGMTNDTQFWNGTTTVADGTIHGGTGTWRVGPTNWTNANGSSASAWGSQFAVFQNNPANVTVDGSAGAIVTTGMQFIGTGWNVGGDAITLDGVGGNTIVRVGDGTGAGVSHTATIASVLAGNSRLIKDDLGTLILTGANTYTGGTRINNGVLQIGNGGTTGSITGDVLNSAALVFNRSNTFDVAGAISGTGVIRQVGTGLTNLTGNSGAFTGTTRVENGTLAVNGTLGGAVEILGTGRLLGAGTVGNTIVSSVIAPGNSIGTLNVAGNITFNAGSIYEVEVNAAGQSDRIVATGTAAINGGTVQVLAGMGAYAPSTTYTILTANGGRTGAFDGVTSNLAFLTPSLSDDANNVYLTMTRNAVSFQNVGITPNQIATGQGTESLGLGNAVYDAVLNLSAPQAQYAFDQLSGEIHASARTALTEDSRFVRNAVNNRIRAAFDGVGASKGTVVTYVDGKPVPVAATTDRLAVWGQGFGSWGHTDGNGNAARLDRKTGGFFIGADAPVFDTWRFGAVAGYSRIDFDAKNRLSSGKSDNYHLGLYGGTQWGDIAFRTGAAYTWHDVSTSRNVIFPGLSNSLKGDYNAATAQIFGELAYGFNAGGTRFEPFANLAYVNLHTDRFTETGGTAALTSPSANTDATFTTIGLRGSTSFDMGGTVVTAQGMLGWRHAFSDVTPDAVMRFAGGGNAFSIGGVPIARNAAAVEAGLDFALSPAATFGVTYGGQFGSGVIDQSVKANFNVKF